MQKSRLAPRLVRLYPRAWRERYEDEFLALLDQTPLTASIAVDLLVCAIRERVRATMHFDPQPVSRARELWRGGIITVVLVCGMSAGSWLVGSWLRESGYRDLLGQDRKIGWLLFLLPVIRACVVFIWRSVAWYRATLALSVPMPEPSLRFALGPIEYYGWLAAVFATSVLVQTTAPSQPWLFSTPIFWVVTWLRFATRTELARRDLLAQLEETNFSNPLGLR
jgi:hypothetical protein